ncbi:MAG: excinuclease ABC subunit A [Candidatus Komeilibacteria bacterium RIFCSPLOWO2_01_FULL_45_10]|uniref:UvrABC system protein A n=1 Tax=Candidatus Komeilibacteria bacterium RIFCSPLOWO2_01_FULL_45_10 TaxID=1798550 RepID=A0A1G2BKR5_9BACT|nr:MAG: excinuclease ABC subunit A [Candidatus Komeilibacteria bacterium RIFCSPLOWO2_01_FULL_45_10]
MSTDKIIIRGARVHNLKNIDVEIPRDQLVVITGLSGSGKSSLAFDTIYAEGQRRYVESLSAYARQFLGLMDKPDVDQIEGLSPAISIDQKSTSHNPRSTVGTITEIYDYLRLLFARVGHAHCPNCGQEIATQTTNQIAEKILNLPQNSEVWLLAPVIKDKKGEHRHVLSEFKKSGYSRVRVDGQMYAIEEALDLDLDKQKKHTLEVVVDRLTPDREDKKRLVDSLEIVADLGDGVVIAHLPASSADRPEHKKDLVYSRHLSCPKCDINLPKIEPRNFSFNSPHGACPECSGLGTKLEIDPELVIPNKKLSLAEGAIRPWSRTAANQSWYFKMLENISRAYKFSTRVPVNKLTKKQLEIVLRGTGEKRYNMNYLSDKFAGEITTAYEGVIPNLERRYRETESDYIRSEIERYMRVYQCPQCLGKRLRPEVLSVTVGHKNIHEITTMTIKEATQYFGRINNGKHLENIKFTLREAKIANQILKEIKARLTFLEDVGLSYLTLDRAATTLSGGESQRIRLATQIGSSLVGVLYILDEPSIGLHQKDNDKLIKTLKALRDLGNTIIVVEHDEQTILNADWVIDIGPGAGEHGGEIIACGTPAEIQKNSDSLTGQYLAGELSIEPPKKYRSGNGKFLEISGAGEFNLKNIDVKIPLGKFVCISGVSGSGKSTLMTEILAKALNAHFYRAKELPGKHQAIKGLEHLDKVIDIDQSPIGRTPRSNPATYTGVFTYIRDLFSELPEAKIRGYKAGRFSFNVDGGRCEACQGDGMVRIEMNFLPDVYVECEECHAQRYNPQTLEVHYKGKNIAEVLAMTVEEAMKFFVNVPNIYQKLKTLNEVGLGYIKLGQSATTLSGGEAQRVKLSAELSRRSTGKTLYILDEPTTGLHFDDIKRLLQVLNKLVDKGNTVLIIEHQLDVIKCADWIIDLGPEGGDEGGEIVACGTPKDVAKVKKSYTGQYLKKLLKI